MQENGSGVNEYFIKTLQILSLQPLRPESFGQPQPPQQPKVVQPILPTEEQLQDFSKMFPNIDTEIIK